MQLNLSPNQITPLPSEPPYFEASAHQWSQPEIDALTLAIAARRPLLVRGEPGVGKTQIARAIATHCDYLLHSVTIHPRFEPQHLIARLDAVLRLADAQANKLTGTPDQETKYWTPGPIWCAYDWNGAQKYLDQGGTKPRGDANKGHVILIDEIDKADSDLPNSLLELLGQRAIQFAPLKLNLGGPDAQLPLVIITTNEERELPAAFVRRCVVLNLAAPEDYFTWLVGRGRAHYREQSRYLADAVLEHAARQLLKDREAMQQAGLPPPGAAEYLDLLAAVFKLAPEQTESQLSWLDRLSAYAFVKHSDNTSDARKQSRPSVPRE